MVIPTPQIPTAIAKIQNERRDLEREIGSLKVKMAQAKAGDLKDKARQINGIQVISAEFDGDPKTLRKEADRLRDSMKSVVVVLGSRKKGVQIIAAVTKDLKSKVHAGNLIKTIAPIIEGRGGGRPDMAQAGGKRSDKLPEALEAVFTYIETLS